MYTGIDVYRHFHSLLHRTVRQLYHEVRTTDAASFHLESLLLRHSLQEGLYRGGFRILQGSHERPENRAIENETGEY